MPGGGETPADGEMPSDAGGEMPGGGQMPTDGEMPGGGQMPADGEMPSDAGGAMPSDAGGGQGGPGGGGMQGNNPLASRFDENDAVLYFEGERGHHYRILRAVKNRFGPANEIGVFEMNDTGLAEVANPSRLFLAERHGQVSGTAGPCARWLDPLRSFS